MNVFVHCALCSALRIHQLALKLRPTQHQSKCFDENATDSVSLLIAKQSHQQH